MSTKVRPSNAYGRRLIRGASELGFTWRFDGSGHLCFECHGAAVRAPNTPRSPDEAFKHVMSKLRKAAGVRG